MKTILTTMTVLAVCVGLSGCMYPVRDGRGDQRENQNWQAQQSRPARDCVSRDGRWYCAD
jgi:hypothetical protein